VLEKAGMGAGAAKIAVRGGEGYETDLFIDEVRRRPEKFILAYEMNGKPLAAEHGFPLRVVADGKYAYKWCKWLTSLELVSYDFKGHYEGKRRWSDAATRGRPVI
jgi:DMSO/TMAO reductase YedYZ molybdopterin-dependent catalytic subunit